jgi:DNA (cytosine-5)-methyltransferase 1
MSSKSHFILRVGTDFSGIGAPEQALTQLNVPHVVEFACDFDKFAKQSYLSNYSPNTFYDNVATRDHSSAPEVDLYVGGFPCQTFSIAGKRAGFNDTRGTLFFDLLQYLKLKTPKYFILENVKGLVNHDKGNTYKTIMTCLRELKYTLYAKVLNTKHYGIPQNRERIFIVGFRDEHYFEFPQKINLNYKIKDFLESDVDERFYLKREQIEKLQEYNRRNAEKGNGFRAKFHDTEKDMMSTIKVGGAGADDLITETMEYNLTTGPKGLKKDSGTSQKRLEFRKDDVVNTITTHCLDSMVGDVEWIADWRTDEGVRIRKDDITPCLTTSATPITKIHKERVRRLTPLECLRLQGFPDSFYKNCKENGISDNQLYKQAGNSMSVNVLKGLIIKILENEKRYI